MKIISYILVLFHIHIINKSKKLSIYSDMLEDLNKQSRYLRTCGFCINLKSRLFEHSLPYSLRHKIFWYFPELYLQKPLFKKDGQWWWNRYYKKIRIKALEKAISLIK